MSGAKQSQSVQGGRFVVVGIGFMEAPHGVTVRQVPGPLVLPFGVQDLHRREVRTLPVCTRLRGTLLGSGAEAGQGDAASHGVLLLPNRMVVGHGLSPIGHGEIRLSGLGSLEGLGGVLVLEAVHEENATDERGVRIGRA